MTDQKSVQIPDLSLLSPETAPIVYCDGVAASGIHNGAIQIELATRMLCPTEDGGVTTKIVMTGHLRYSPAALADLRQHIDGIFQLLEAATAQPPKPEGKLN